MGGDWLEETGCSELEILCGVVGVTLGVDTRRKRAIGDSFEDVGRAQRWVGFNVGAKVSKDVAGAKRDGQIFGQPKTPGSMASFK
jgi:hypothetical protein